MAVSFPSWTTRFSAVLVKVTDATVNPISAISPLPTAIPPEPPVRNRDTRNSVESSPADTVLLFIERPDALDAAPTELNVKILLSYRRTIWTPATTLLFVKDTGTQIVLPGTPVTSPT